MLRKICDGIYCYESKSSKTTCYDGFCFEDAGDNDSYSTGICRSTYFWIGVAVLAIVTAVIFA